MIQSLMYQRKLMHHEARRDKLESCFQLYVGTLEAQVKSMCFFKSLKIPFKGYLYVPVTGCFELTVTENQQMQKKFFSLTCLKAGHKFLL